jgi:hypothetical protein
MSPRKSEITGRMNERDFPHLVELELPPGGIRNKSKNLNRSTVNAASQFGEVAAGTRESNSTSVSAFQMGPPLTPFTAASAARA